MIGRRSSPDKPAGDGTSGRGRALTRRMRAGETMNRRRIAAAVVAFLAVLSTGCLVEIHHGGDVEAAFRTARAEVERDRGRRGAVHRLNVLVFDPQDNEIVRVSMPMWLARKLEGHIQW